MSSFPLRPYCFVSITNFDYEHLKIPRKPAWSRSMTAEQVERNERDAFLEWRREIAVKEIVEPSVTSLC
jgi:hypothetical protein